MINNPPPNPLLRLVSLALAAGATLLGSAEPASAQALVSLAPAVAVAQPVFPSWSADDLTGQYGAGRPGSAAIQRFAPANVILGAAGSQSSSSVALPELRWWTDGVLGALGLGGNAIGLTLSVTRQDVPQEGLDPSGINWGIDRNTIGNPSTSAGT